VVLDFRYSHASLQTITVAFEEGDFAGCSKDPGCEAPKILRSEAYLTVRRNDEGREQRRKWGLFSSPQKKPGQIHWHGSVRVSWFLSR
jgi:hypothetical protein